MNDDKRKKMAELQRQSDYQDRQAEERDHQHAVELLDVALAPAADAVTGSIIQLAEQLAELDLISEENPGTPRWRVDVGDPDDLVTGIEAAHPDAVARLYGFYDDAIVATRMRDDGRYEHAMLDEHGMPIEWRTACRADLN